MCHALLLGKSALCCLLSLFSRTRQDIKLSFNLSVLPICWVCTRPRTQRERSPAQARRSSQSPDGFLLRPLLCGGEEKGSAPGSLTQARPSFAYCSSTFTKFAKSVSHLLLFTEYLYINQLTFLALATYFSLFLSKISVDRSNQVSHVVFGLE